MDSIRSSMEGIQMPAMKKASDFSEAFAVRTGLEPATPCVTGMYSNQLNYRTCFPFGTANIACFYYLQAFFLKYLAYHPFLHFLGIFGKLKGIDNLLNITIHDVREVVKCHSDAVFGNPALWIIIGAYLGRPVAGRYHGFPLGCNVAMFFLYFKLIKF